jgi:dephospho-CoA kinase
LARKGMSEANLAAILSRQTPDAEKRRRAHFVIDTRGALEKTRAQAQQFLRAVAGIEGRRGHDA